MRRIYFQGTTGAFSEVAAHRFFGGSIKAIGRRNFQEVFEQVIQDQKAYGIIPIENSLSGSIHKNYDLLLQYRVWIVGEITLRIGFDLMCLPGVRFASIREVWSHPVVFNQCEKFFARYPGLQPIPVYDSAGAARLLKKKKCKDVAVIAGSQVAEFYKLKVLRKGIEDNPQNFTRFFILSPKQRFKDGDNTKTSLVFGVHNAPGILFKCLSIFALRNIDLTKLESRPIIGKPWEYLFYIDFNGSIEDENCRHAVDTLKEVVSFLKILGSYETKGVL